MHVTLLHNPTAGDEDHSPDALSSLIRDAGHDVRYLSLKESGWQHALRDGTELVAIAGGDGSIGKVIRELSTGGPAATILPLGSANNIARALGLADNDLGDLVRGWSNGERRRLFLGRVSFADGRECFVESTGGGLFAESLRRAKDHADVEDKVELGLRLLRELLDELPARRWRVFANDEDCSGEFLAVEAMIVGETGPNVPLAPHADPGDPLLDLVLVTDNERGALATYLEERLRGGEPDPPSLPTRRVREVTMSPPAKSAFRVDDSIWDAETLVLSGGRRSVQLLHPVGV